MKKKKKKKGEGQSIISALGLFIPLVWVVTTG